MPCIDPRHRGSSMVAKTFLLSYFSDCLLVSLVVLNWSLILVLPLLIDTAKDTKTRAAVNLDAERLARRPGRWPKQRQRSQCPWRRRDIDVVWPCFRNSRPMNKNRSNRHPVPRTFHVGNLRCSNNNYYAGCWYWSSIYHVVRPNWCSKGPIQLN